ncbi:transglutaminase family protein [Arsenicitalea aurantiaca]|uniref:Transglutaminase family protein n=1 Tax=Arsenicitalea aurantiaca TaxID=1783274 RepID=A0A433X420_9HYPH|nr:transglutaminase family protein [Arsenicitalea aurantiaca]RUT28802.1 transglutaminase family protein [Arsenicitalea aurantiaca]
MKFSLGCHLGYEVTTPTTMILNIEAMRLDRQQVQSESLIISPFVEAEPHWAIESGNLYRRLVLEPGEYTIDYRAEIDLVASREDPAGIAEMPVSRIPLEVLPYLYPSRYCQSDLLARFAWREFGEIGTGHDRMTAICNWIYQHVDYLSGSSDSATSAYDTFSQRAGVCRDFAHLGITFARALGIPARFISSYAWQLVPQDFHAVFEAYLGGRWYLFDATRLAPLDSIVRIGMGRDAADTAFATFYGSVVPQPKSVWIEPVDGAADPAREWTTEAVSVVGG